MLITLSTAYNKAFGGISNAFSLLGYIPNKKSIAFHTTNEEIKEAMNGNICRCGTYNKILKAVTTVAKG